MSERNAAAVRIHPLAREAAERMLDAGLVADEILVLQSFDMAEHLRRKCLVNFPERDVVVFQAMSCQETGDRRYWSHQQPLVKNIDGCHFEIHQACARQIARQSI